MEFGYVVLLHVKIYFRAYFPLNVTIFHVLWNSYSPPPHLPASLILFD